MCICNLIGGVVVFVSLIVDIIVSLEIASTIQIVLCVVLLLALVSQIGLANQLPPCHVAGRVNRYAIALQSTICCDMILT